MPLVPNQWDYTTNPGIVKHFYGFQHTLGGIVSIRAGDFERTGGYTNYWSWGGEDNAFQQRCIQNGLQIDRSRYFPILDKHIIHLQDGFMRDIFSSETARQSRDEYSKYSTNKEGWAQVQNIRWTWEPETCFVHVDHFDTAFAAPLEKERKQYDILREGKKASTKQRYRMAFT